MKRSRKVMSRRNINFISNISFVTCRGIFFLWQYGGHKMQDHREEGSAPKSIQFSCSPWLVACIKKRAPFKNIDFRKIHRISFSYRGNMKLNRTRPQRKWQLLTVVLRPSPSLEIYNPMSKAIPVTGRGGL
jgi:hypothetical protein